jgi:formate-dependent nitrite reductase cytochrome c552 subunit
MEETPEVVQAWYAGKHGVNNVKCFVCHGSTGSDFSTQVSMDRCVGCHADHVDAMKTSFMAKKTCFSCHPQHELNPHVQQVQGGVQ